MKKIFAIIMSVLMIACFMPTMAFADGEQNEELVTAINTFLSNAGEDNHTFTLSGDITWPENTPVYWKAEDKNSKGGSNNAVSSGFAATLKAALEAAYKANKDNITIVCRPNADVGEITHGHVADNLTIYGNDAYISGGECDLEVDTYKYNRNSGSKSNQDGSELDKNITITAYEMDNLGVWSGRQTNHTVEIKLVDCDGRNLAKQNESETSPQRIMVQGSAGVTNVCLEDCDFISYSECTLKVDVSEWVTLENCTFKNVAEPINLKHDGANAAEFTVKNCTFTGCGSTKDDDKDYAAPIRFVNGTGGKGSVTATVENCNFSGTIGTNGDILIGDGRNEKNNDYEITLSVKDAGSATTVMAQKSNYYGKNKTATDSNKVSTVSVEQGATLNTSWSKMFANVQIGDEYYESLESGIEKVEGAGTVTLLKDVTSGIAIPESETVTIDIAGHTLSLGESGTVTVGDNGKLIIEDSVGNGKVSFDPSEYLESSRYYASKTTDDDTTYWTIKRYTYSGSSSSSSTTTTTDSVTNTTEDKKTDTSTDTGSTTETNKVATTTATVKTETKTATDGTKTTTATVDTTTASKIVEKAVENKSEEVVVNTASAATVTETAAGTKTEVALPEQTVKAIAKETEAAVTIKSDAAEVKLDTEAVKAVADQAGDLGTVSLVVETVAQSESKVEVDLKLVTSKGTVSDFKGGNVSVTVKLNTALAAKPVVCVYIDDFGTYHKVKGVKNADGTYTFETGHFSTYAVIAEDEADGVIAEQTKNVEEKVGDLSLKARSEKTEKGNIKVTLTVDEDAIKAIEDLGYTVKYKFYRSTKKSASYKAALEKTDKTYTNTTGKKGTKYYYKARVIIYDAQGELVTKTELKQCRYACRTK